MQKLTAEETAKEIGFTGCDPELKKAIEELQPGEAVRFTQDDWNEKFKKANAIRYCNKYFNKQGIPVEVYKTFGAIVIMKGTKGASVYLNDVETR